MRTTQLSLRPVVRSLWCRLLDGPHVWGFFDVMVGRYGLRRYRLVVFPPGIGSADRRLLRMWRGWPVGGGLLALLTVMLLGESLSAEPITFDVAAAAYLGVGALLFVLTTSTRAGVRSTSLMMLGGDLDPREQRRFEEWEMLVVLLTQADDMLKSGAIHPAQHEALWWKAYERLGVDAHV